MSHGQDDFDDELARSVAEGMEAELELLPWLPRLLENVEVLGTPPDWVCEILSAGGLAEGSRVLDLGCGKGAVALAITESTGASVVGVDGLEAFVLAARRRAAELGLDDRARFEVGDLRAWPPQPDAVDCVIYTGIGDLLFDYEETLAFLRTHVSPNGLIVFEDCYELDDGSRDAIVRALTARGDELLAERTLAPDALARFNAETNDLIAASAARLKVEHPEAASRIEAYVARQRDEAESLEDEMHCGLWLLRRGVG